jgi:hypothetical protein
MNRAEEMSSAAWESCLWELVDLLYACVNALAECLRRCHQHDRAGGPAQEVQENWQGAQQDKGLEPPAPVRIVPHPVYPARAQHFYAVVVGRRPGIYESWYEAAKQVVGYGGNVHRAFSTREEAEFFLQANRNLH